MKFRYEDLDVGNDILEMIDLVYKATKGFPDDERFGLISQMRRSSTSVYLNLAEGTGKRSKPDFIRYLTISLGSLVETHASFKIALRRRYISSEEYLPIDQKIKLIWRRLCALRDSQS